MSVHQYKHEEVVILTIISIAIIITGLILNILVLLGYLCSRSMRQKPSSIFLVSMTFGQLLTVSVVIPLQLATQVLKPSLAANGGALCTFIGSMTYAPYVAISETVLCTTVDRYLAVCFPIRYRTIITRRRAFAVVSFTWVHTVITAIITVPFGFKVEYNPRVGACAINFENRLLEGAMSAVAYAVIPFSIIVALSWKMIRHFRRHNRIMIGNTITFQQEDDRNNRDPAREGL